MIVFLAEDAGTFKESEHPRDNDGKFTSGGAGGSSAGNANAGLSGWKKTWWQASGVKKTLKQAGYELTKSEDDLPTWIHPSGAKVVVHPPQKEQKNSSNWVAHKPGALPVPGTGSANLAEILGVVVAKAQAKQVQINTPKPSNLSPEAEGIYNKIHANTSKFTAAANGFLKDKGYGNAQPGALGNSVVLTKTGGGKVMIEPGSLSWVAETPGHMTKKGTGLENLQKLLSGEPAVFKAGENPPWENTSIQVETKVDADNAAKKAKLVDAIHSHYSSLKQHAPAPSSAQANALATYGGSGYASINAALRHGEGGSTHIKNATKHIDEYLKNAELPEDTTLYRGVKGEYAKILKSILLEGTKFVDKGFVSTSVRKEISEGFSHGLLFKINAPKGTKGAAIGSYSGHHGEHEVLLPRNTVFKVKSYDPHSGHVEVDVEHLQ